MSSRAFSIAILAGILALSACEPAEETSDPVTAAPTLAPATSPSPAPTPVAFKGWRSAAPMIVDRTGFDAVVLGDGTVLAVGDDQACLPGPAEPGSERAEQYDPVGDAWVEVPSLNKPRAGAATVVLSDGSAMVLGGMNDTFDPFSSTKVFEPETGGWTDGPLMVLGRTGPRAVTLPDGGVFVVSDTATSDAGFTSELMDPASGSWIETAPLPSRTWIDQMVGLADGTVLAVGTFSGDSDPTPVAYVYDPAEDTWAGVQGLPRLGFALVGLADGRALAIGGNDGGELWGGTGAMTADVHRFEPGRGVWVPVAPMSTVRDLPQVVLLADGRVLVAGGYAGSEFDGAEALVSTELYDAATDRWTPGPDLLEPRYGGYAVPLTDGSVLILGGANDFNTQGDTPWCPTPLVTTERLEPAP